MTQLPAGWAERPLSHVARLSSGGTPQATNPAYYGGDIPWAVIGDLNNGVVKETAQAITQAGLDNSSAKIVPVGTILVGMYGSIGKLGIAGTPMATNQAIATVQVSDEVDVQYLFYYLLAQRRNLDRQGKGATQRNISQTILKPWPVRFPPQIDKQRRIVGLLEDHLSRLDAAESLVATSLRRLMSLRRSVLAEFHDGDLTALSELAVDSGYGTSEKCVPDGPGPAVVRIPNLINGRIDLSDEKRIASVSCDVERYRLIPGDLLIVRTNGSVDLIGRSAVVQDGVDAAFASYLIRYQLRPDRVIPEWVQAMLSTPQVRAKIESLAASSAGQHNLSLGKLNPLELPVPTLEVQAACLSRLADIEDHVSRLRAELSTAQSRGVSLRRSLLAAAFSGQLTNSKPQKERWESVLGV